MCACLVSLPHRTQISFFFVNYFSSVELAQYSKLKAAATVWFFIQLQALKLLTIIKSVCTSVCEHICLSHIICKKKLLIIHTKINWSRRVTEESYGLAFNAWAKQTLDLYLIFRSTFVIQPGERSRACVCFVNHWSHISRRVFLFSLKFRFFSSHSHFWIYSPVLNELSNAASFVITVVREHVLHTKSNLMTIHGL